MGYKIKVHEWELTEEEQEQAEFIVAWTDEQGKRLRHLGEQGLSADRTAFEMFKRLFYGRVTRRLGLKEANPFFVHADDFGSFNVSEDCKVLIGHRVEKDD